MTGHHSTLSVWIEGAGAWTPELADWPAMRSWLQGGELPAAGTAGKPKPAVLSAGERRRAPMSVLMAIEVANQAVTMSGHEPDTLPAIFGCAHGDADILDYTCATLATAPTELSPTRFHNSVHNAAAGYWTMATGCHAASTALTALEYTFAASLLEAASVTSAETRPVLLVTSDGPGPGPLGEVIASRRYFACALVLAPQRSQRSLARLDIHLAARQASSTWPALIAPLAEANLSARGLGLLQALAKGVSSTLRLPAAPLLDLDLLLEPD